MKLNRFAVIFCIMLAIMIIPGVYAEDTAGGIVDETNSIAVVGSAFKSISGETMSFTSSYDTYRNL